MKYKNLKSMAHNHTHSFVSSMNFVDDKTHILKEIRNAFTQIEEREITVTWLPAMQCSTSVSEALLESIGYWGRCLPAHISNHEVTTQMVASFVTRFSITIQRGIRVESVLVDDRGREYKQIVCG